MTENEAKVKLERTSVLWNNAKLTEIVEAVKVAIQAIERVQKFEAIGTIEEFKALKEKSVAKKDFSGCICNNVERDWDFAK